MPRVDLIDLAELEHEDPEMVPEIVAIDAKLSFRGPVAKVIELFERASAITPSKEVIPGTGYALLEAVAGTGDAVAHLKITAADGEQSLSVSVDGVLVGMAGEALVPPRKVLDILKMAPDERVHLEVIGDQLTIRSGRPVWRVALPLGERLAALPEVSGIELRSVVVKPFLSALQGARRAMPSAEARPALMQALVRNQTVTASDGGRVHRQHIEQLDDLIDFSIPRKVADELIRALRATSSERFEMGSNDYHLVFRIDQDTLSAQRMLVGFPDDVEALVLKATFSNTHTLTADRVDLLDTIKRVRINADPDFTGIFLSLVPTETGWSLAVRSKDRAGNAAQEIIECTWDGSGKGRELCVNHKYLSDLLASYTENEIAFKIGDDTKGTRTPLLVDDASTGFTGIVQQMNSNWLR